MKKIISLILVICMAFAGIVANGAELNTERIGFAETISNQQAWSVEIFGDYCYVSSRAGGIQIFDISDVTNIRNISNTQDMKASVQTDGRNVKVYDGYMYAGFEKGLSKFSLDNPAEPSLVASNSGEPKIIGMAFYNGLMFATTNDGVLDTIDITSDTLKRENRIGRDSVLGKHKAVFVHGDYLYATCEKGLKVFDVSNGMTEILKLDLSSIGGGNINNIFVTDKAVIMADWGGEKPLYIFDVSDGRDISTMTADDLITYSISGYKPRGIYVDNDILYYTSDTGVLTLLDISEPKNPFEILSKSGMGQLPDVTVKNNVIYMTNRGAGIITAPVPEIAYLKLSDEAYTKFPIDLKGNILGSSKDYELYVDGIKLKEGNAENGIEEKIYSLPNGAHTLGIATAGSENKTEYTVNVSALPMLEISLEDAAGNKADSIENIDGKINIVNNSTEDIEANVIAALYANNSLKAYNVYPINITSGESIEKELDLSGISADSSCALKIFAVKSCENPALMSNSVELYGNEYEKFKSDANIASQEMFDVRIAGLDHASKTVEIGLKQNALYGTKTVVEVLKPNGTGFADVDYIDVIDIEEEIGRVKYCFKSETEEIPFKVAVSNVDIFGGFITRETGFTYVGASTINKILDNLEKSENTEKILKDNSELMRIDMSEGGEFYKLDEKYRDYILKCMKTKFESLDGVKITFDSLTECAAVLKKINDADNADDLKQLLANEETRKLLGINGEVFSLMSDAALDEMYQFILDTSDENKKYSVEEFSVYFNDEAALRLINGAGYLQMGSVLEALSDKFDLKGDYSRLNNTENELIYVHKIMERTEFKSISDAVTTFNGAVAEAINSRKSNSQISSGSGGKGSGKGSGSVNNVTMGTVAEPSNDETAETFTDINEAAWAKDSILALSSKKIINGYPDNTFRPNASVKREEFAKMIVAAFGITSSESEIEFSDAAKTDWYYEYVRSLSGSGIINGVGDNMFGSGTELTREDMAVIIARVARYKNISINESAAVRFDDFAEISDYASKDVELLANGGIMTGYDNKFNPNDTVTRAMAAKVIAELLNA